MSPAEHLPQTVPAFARVVDVKAGPRQFDEEERKFSTVASGCGKKIKKTCKPDWKKACPRGILYSITQNQIKGNVPVSGDPVNSVSRTK